LWGHPAQELAEIRRKPPLVHFSGLAVETTCHDRSRMHIQPDTDPKIKVSDIAAGHVVSGSKDSDVRFEGPLAPFAGGFRDDLRQLGYTQLSAVHQLRLMAHLSRWRDEHGWSGRDLTEGCVVEYLASRRATGYTLHYGRRAMVPLLDFLAAQQVTPIAPPPHPPSSGVEALLGRFGRYLVSERVLSHSTIAAYIARGGRFLSDYTIDGKVSALRTADVTRASAEAGRVSVSEVQYYVAVVRALLRYCHLQASSMRTSRRRRWPRPVVDVAAAAWNRRPRRASAAARVRSAPCERPPRLRGAGGAAAAGAARR
jgi:hypothetical protein